jgi:hypothetical protein
MKKRSMHELILRTCKEFRKILMGNLIKLKTAVKNIYHARLIFIHNPVTLHCYKCVLLKDTTCSVP